MPRTKSSAPKAPKAESLEQRLRPQAETYEAARFAWLSHQLPDPGVVGHEAWAKACAENERLERRWHQAACDLADSAASAAGVQFRTPDWIIADAARDARPTTEAVRCRAS